MVMAMRCNSPVVNGLHHVAFNQDQGCFCCGLASGFRIYNCDPLKEKVRQDWPGCGIGCVEMLFRCNYVAFVGNGTNHKYPANKVFIWDDLKKRSVIELEFFNDVCAVRLRRDRIVVVLETMIKVYSFTQTPQALHVFQTTPNSRGMCVLCPSSSASLLGFPAGRPGRLQLVDLSDPGRPSVDIDAHETALSCLQMNLTGSRVATASQKGTLIRVFDTSSGQLISELRRGSNNAQIYCISFSQDSSLLCVSSDHGTVHVFSLQETPAKPKPETSRDLTSSLADSAVATLLPKYFNSRCSFARFQVSGGTQCICAFSNDNKSIIVVCADGSFYKYGLSLPRGDCTREIYAQFMEMGEDG